MLAPRRGEERRHLRGCDRLADAVALSRVAAQRADSLELLTRLDPFGHEAEPESLSEPDDGSDHALVLGSGDEGPIELELRHRDSATRESAE